MGQIPSSHSTPGSGDTGAATKSHYELLGVDPSATDDECVIVTLPL